MAKRSSLQVNVHEAKTQLSKLLAKVEQGEEVVIARDGKPIAKLVPFRAPAKKRLRVGDWKGRIWMSPDFDAPLSEEELEEWGM
jgi:prevent-host-death family protein